MLKALNSKQNSLALLEGAKQTDMSDDPFLELYDYISNFKTKNSEILLTIVLPMYNEEHTIGKVLGNLPRENSIQIIVVDDHSTDSSLQEIEMVNENNDIEVIHHKINKGYGASILSGIKRARGRVIVTMDSDGQHSPYDILTMIKPVFDNEADYTIGSRYLGSYFYKLPVSTRLGEVLIEKLILIFFGKRIMNNQNGFRAFNRKIIPIFDEVKYEGYAFCTEQIIKATLKGFRIKECPIKVYDRKFGASNIILTKLAANLFSCILQYYLIRLNITIFKRLSTGQIQIYEKSVRKSRIYAHLKYTKDVKTINPVFFIERNSPLFPMK